MSLSSSSRAAETNHDPVRLSYRVTLRGLHQGVTIDASIRGQTRALADAELKRLLPRLHPLDVTIAREVRSGTVYGQLGDSQFARVLPLLLQRRTTLDGHRLQTTDFTLRPRLQVDTNVRSGFRLSLVLEDPEDASRFEVSEGRLFAGSQAYFLRGHWVSVIEAPDPWELAPWARAPVRELAGELNPHERDRLVRELRKIGVPQVDLDLLAVRRAPPERFVARVWAEPDSAAARLLLEADYAGDMVVIAGARPLSPYILGGTSGEGGMTERDLAVEEEARHIVRLLGFRFDKAGGTFIARGEAGLKALDPGAHLFPADWFVERSADAPQFHGDLNLHAEVRLLESQGLLDVAIGIEAVGGSGEGDEANEREAVEALVQMKDLLKWLHSGKTYLRLDDGSYVAPSAGFRRTLQVLDDLGAESKRALVSPLCVGLLRAIGDWGALAAADTATRDWLAEISGQSAPQSVEIPPGISGTLRDYQRHGLNWLAMLHRHRLTGILADDMGLGKTLQTLVLLLHVRGAEGHKPSLVIAPTSVVGVWRDEAARFAPGLNVVLWSGPPKIRHALRIDDADLVVTSYGIIRRDAEMLAKVPFRYVILDEAQSAKNAASQNARAVRRLTSERRLALTGTPIENRPEELWATFDFLAPGFLGSLRQFRKRYARPIARGESDATTLLRARINPLVLRRLKAEVAKELPPRIESTLRCEMSTAQRALYDHVAGRLRENVQRKIEKVGIERAHLDILAALTRLRQICCDPALLPNPDHIKTPPSAKLELFTELMREALESERHVLVFSQFVQMQKRLIANITELGVKPLWLHGGTRNRAKVVDTFQDPNGPPVIVVSLRAGGTGLTLTRADTVMHYDPWWNPAVERQATDRAHRLGQTQRVTVYKLICAGTIEERVQQLATRKDALAEELLGSEGGAGAKHISTQEVLDLLR